MLRLTTERGCDMWAGGCSIVISIIKVRQTFAIKAANGSTPRLATASGESADTAVLKVPTCKPASLSAWWVSVNGGAAQR